MSKLKKLNIKQVNRKAFHNLRSYEAALYAVNIVNLMIHRCNRGDIIFEYENIVRPDFAIRLDSDGNFSELSLRDSENCRTTIVGCTWDAVSGKIYCTKREIREYFKLWRVARLADVTKVSDLTK